MSRGRRRCRRTAEREDKPQLRRTLAQSDPMKYPDPQIRCDTVLPRSYSAYSDLDPTQYSDPQGVLATEVGGRRNQTATTGRRPRDMVMSWTYGTSLDGLITVFQCEV